MTKEADIAKERAKELAEPIRENLSVQEPDSGKIIVCEEAIEVKLWRKMFSLIFSKQKRKRRLYWRKLLLFE